VLALGAGAVALMVFGLAVPSPLVVVGSLVRIAVAGSLTPWTGACRGTGVLISSGPARLSPDPPPSPSVHLACVPV